MCDDIKLTKALENEKLKIVDQFVNAILWNGLPDNERGNLLYNINEFVNECNEEINKDQNIMNNQYHWCVLGLGSYRTIIRDYLNFDNDLKIQGLGGIDKRNRNDEDNYFFKKFNILLDSINKILNN